MTNVPRVQTTSGVPEPPQKKESTPAEPEKFKELMRVEKIDPEEQKKRKRGQGEETEEDALADSLMLESLLTPPQQQPTTPAPLKIESTGTAGISSIPAPSGLPLEPEQEINIQKPAQGAPEPSKDQKEQLPAASSSTHTEPPVKEAKELPSHAPEAFSTPPSVHKPHSPLPYLHTPLKEKKYIPEEIAAIPPPTIPLEGEVPISVPTEEKKKIKEIESLEAPAPQTAPLQPSEISITPPTPPSAPSLLPHEVQELFHRTIDVITVMTLTGLKETTISLQGPQFASSVFFGSQIIIQEFSTAPGSFNIQLLGSAPAVALFDKHMENLMRTFQSGEYTFRINRLEARLDTRTKATEEPLFKRKEKPSQDTMQDQKGNSES